MVYFTDIAFFKHTHMVSFTDIASFADIIYAVLLNIIYLKALFNKLFMHFLSDKNKLQLQFTFTVYSYIVTLSQTLLQTFFKCMIFFYKHSIFCK